MAHSGDSKAEKLPQDNTPTVVVGCLLRPPRARVKSDHDGFSLTSHNWQISGRCKDAIKTLDSSGYIQIMFTPRSSIANWQASREAGGRAGGRASKQASQSKAKQSKAKQGKARQGKARQSKQASGQGKARQGKARQSKAQSKQAS